MFYKIKASDDEPELRQRLCRLADDLLSFGTYLTDSKKQAPGISQVEEIMATLANAREHLLHCLEIIQTANLLG